MSKTITIPSDRGSVVRLTVNGRDYTYAAGTTVEVPDEVAALFESNSLEEVKTGRHAVAPLTAPERKGDRAGKPVMTDDQGRLYIPEDGGGALDDIYVEGHKLIIPYSGE